MLTANVEKIFNAIWAKSQAKHLFSINFSKISQVYSFLIEPKLINLRYSLTFFCCPWKFRTLRLEGSWVLISGSSSYKKTMLYQLPSHGVKETAGIPNLPRNCDPLSTTKVRKKIFLTFFWEPWTTEHELKRSSFGCRKSFLSWTNRCRWIYKLLYYCFSIARLNTFSFEQHTFIFSGLSFTTGAAVLYLQIRIRLFYGIHLLCFSMSSNINLNHFKENLINIELFWLETLHWESYLTCKDLKT